MITLQALLKWLSRPYVKNAILAVFVLSIGGYGYSLWRKRIETRAYAALSELCDRYDAAVEREAESVATTMKEIAEDAEKSYQDYSSSRLAPYFLVCRAHALLLLNDYEGAKRILSEACKKLAHYPDNIFGAYYRISLANCMLNKGGSEQEIVEALDMLRVCAQEKSNPFHEMAMYFHGLYLLNHVGMTEADEVWAPLIKDPVYQSSEWRVQALNAREGL